ncbi:MAG: dTDP-4-dehydrorhamnose 3,5-epimerase [Desulfobacterales bacterium]|nr:dTDP-4-dehydrorhamnose 3,5-epimerase [Desulfobacterales bacterium]
MKIITTKLPSVLIIEPNVFSDQRGFFMETYQKNRYKAKRIFPDFVQDNLSYSVRNTLRGLHYQLPNGQAKLIQVIKGEIFDVVLDIRLGSPTFGNWVATYLSERNKRQLFVPQGFAHGFCVISEYVFLVYKCSDFYKPESERGVLWSDPDINIDWPIDEPVLSEKDCRYPCLKNVLPEHLPVYIMDES